MNEVFYTVQVGNCDRKFREGTTYLDIAKMLNKKPKTIDNALTRIKSKLRRIKKS